MKQTSLIIKLMISVGILAIFLFRLDMATVRDIVAHISASAWVYAILLIIAQMCLLSLRWQILLNIGRRHLTFQDSVKITLSSMLANLLLITSVGGIFVRIALAVQYGASLLKSFIATAMDRMMTLAALIILSAVFLPMLAPKIDSELFQTIAVWVGISLVLLFVFMPLFVKYLAQTLPGLTRQDRRIRYGLRYLQVALRHKKILAMSIVTSLLAQSAYFIAVYCVALSTGIDVSFWKMMAVLPVIALIASLPIGVGGWGVREGAFIFGLGLLGVPLETAFLISVQIGLIGMLTTVLAGLPLILTMDISHVKTQAILLTSRLRDVARPK